MRWSAEIKGFESYLKLEKGLSPKSIEAYYQEAGRAGRDEKKAYAAILYEEKDVLDLYAQWEKSFPTAEIIKRTYQALSNYLQVAEGSGELQSYDFDWMDLCKRFNLPSSQTYFALKTLEAEGLLLLKCFNQIFVHDTIKTVQKGNSSNSLLIGHVCTAMSDQGSFMQYKIYDNGDL